MTAGDILKGAKAIGEYIGETELATFKLLERERIPRSVAYKWAGRWRMSKAAYSAWVISRVTAA